MKETKKQIVEQTKNKLCRKYNAELENIREQLREALNNLEKADNKIFELESENCALRQELEDTKVFNKELMFLADIEDEDLRMEKYEEYKNSKSIKELDAILNILGVSV